MPAEPSSAVPPDDTGLVDALASWLPGARWFPAKGSVAPRLSIAERAPLADGSGAAMLLVDAEGHRGVPIRVVVPVDPATGADAARSGAVARWLVRMALGGGTHAGRRGRFVGHPVAAAEVPSVRRVADAIIEVAPLGGDASNTSLRVAVAGPEGPTNLAVKLLRRCRPGIHPEIEYGRFFAEDTRWRGTPALLGWVEWLADGPAEAGGAIATVHAFVPGCESLWDHLVRLSASGDAPADGAAAALAGRLGAVTASMHAALASRPDIPDFAPRPATAAGRRATAERLAAGARAVLADLGAAAVPERFAGRIRTVAAAADRVAAAFDALATTGISAAEIRVHGDYHLGQVLLTADGSRLLPIDFEGEPSRPLEERRRPTSAAKDLAGMCRSFDYLARTTGRGDAALLVGAFLHAYRAAARGGAWWPEDRGEEDVLLDAFMLDKAIYELAYEVANRPDWIGVPLGAIEHWLGERA